MDRWEPPESDFDKAMKEEHDSPVPSFALLEAMSRDDLVGEYNHLAKPILGPILPVSVIPLANFWLQEIGRRDADRMNHQMLDYTKQVTDMTPAMLGYTKDVRDMTATIQRLTIAIMVLTVLTLAAAIATVFVTLGN